MNKKKVCYEQKKKWVGPRPPRPLLELEERLLRVRVDPGGRDELDECETEVDAVVEESDIWSEVWERVFEREGEGGIGVGGSIFYDKKIYVGYWI